ncbi:hypothetical protein Syn7803C16_127 [Synechococcus phage ACG-2014f]|uniref:DUF6321 domain-containing protein n=1 Tax=Synechococcus phage ACG-2014f TaxID=1493511 RepID=A0A0E3I069_9CAUD|nr:hypothetical protein Syn7803C16_127 [Synechococcus phage ACG-2014f]
MGNLHKWFSGSKSKDGKSGWVNVKTGGTCASDEPGEGTPKCVSSSKRDSMTKSERESASSRKKAADPGQQQKSGAAKPTYVSTDKPKKMKKEQFSNWRDNYVATEHEFIDLIKPEPMVGISETKEGQMKAGREQYKKEKEEGRYGGTKPSNEKVAKLMKKLKEETKQDGPEPTTKQTRGAMKNIRSKMNTASHKDPDKKKTKQELAFQKARAKAWGMSEGKESERKDAMPEGDVGHEIHKKAVAQYNKQNPSKKVKEEVEISEEDKKGSGSGKKDSCYNKVKASAKVWPSAYASGRLVQCRKKGADSYGKSTKTEEWKPDPTEKREKKAAKLGRDEEIEKGKSKKYGRDESKIDKLYKRRMAVQFKKKMSEERLDELKCWKGYKRKKGSTPGAPGSCVKEGFSSWRDDLDLMEGVAAWQRKFVSEESKRELQILASKGDKAAMKKLHQLRADGKIGKEPGFEPKRDLPEGAAWTRKEGKNKAGGLNEKGRKSYERENPGSDLKAPQPEGGSRKKSFCARMGGMKKKLTSSKTANDPDSRINKSLRKWNC